MPEFLRRLRGYHRIASYSLSVLMLSILTWYQWTWGLIGWLIVALLVYLDYKAEKSFEAEIEQYISTLSYRIKKVGEEVISDLPLGIILYDEEHKVQWHNRYVVDQLGIEEIMGGKKINDVLPKLEQWIIEGNQEGTFRHQNLVLQLISQPEERLLYLFDHTEYHQLQTKHRQGQVVFLHIHLDNLDEVTQGLDEQRRALMMSEVSRALNNWTQELGIYIKRTNSDKFFGIMNEHSLRQLEENKFEILDTIRELTSQNKIPVTLSIGVGAGTENLLELGQLSQSSLDIALGRGGDQAAVKRGTGKITFYGGKSSAIEKRTRVRARVISHALRDLIRESDQVFIMGHRDPDMDSIGAAIGVLKAVHVNQKTGYILLDTNQQTAGIHKLMQEIKKSEDLYKHFIPSSEALELKTEKSLLVIVDVHRPSLVMEGKVLDSISRRVVIDHHRRGEEFVTEPLLVYMEPYASSTSELVTELLEYQSTDLKMTSIEATAMLAGIVVDTKSFAFRTGSRTFDAASYLRHHGADTSLVQKILKEDMDQFIKRAKIVANAEIYAEKIAISIGEMDEKYGQVLLAQAADTLLTMNQVIASFVLSQRPDGIITISARSLGEINVQMIMEKLEGGGHLTNAATQIEGKSLDEVIEWLKEVIDDYFRGGVKS
ncbi:DHH family phosphoesterase [Caldalkalibacillus mannanilyticus]|uniref:DHH family phosphoesterase n=1 Tax=Caldalkalibacillus mannanilyticus TaxID=1418 RepID=UPI0004697C28|nr:DHH family phosphoesterase [Caldalkalibacillus mannanilyticus]